MLSERIGRRVRFLNSLPGQVGPCMTHIRDHPISRPWTKWQHDDDRRGNTKHLVVTGPSEPQIAAFTPSWTPSTPTSTASPIPSAADGIGDQVRAGTVALHASTPPLASPWSLGHDVCQVRLLQYVANGRIGARAHVEGLWVSRHPSKTWSATLPRQLCRGLLPRPFGGRVDPHRRGKEHRRSLEDANVQGAAPPARWDVEAREHLRKKENTLLPHRNASPVAVNPCRASSRQAGLMAPVGRDDPWDHSGQREQNRTDEYIDFDSRSP